MSWFEFVQEVLVAGGHSRRPGARRSPPPSSTRPAPRRGRANSALDGKALRLCGFPPLRDHADALEELVHALRAH